VTLNVHMIGEKKTTNLYLVGEGGGGKDLPKSYKKSSGYSHSRYRESKKRPE